jgi:membrane protease YdiL (CAAX protease family)
VTDSAPGGGTFSLHDRPAPGLYLVAWLLSVGGLVLLVLAGMAAVDIIRIGLLIGGFVALSAGLAAAAGYQVLARRQRDPARYRGPSPVLIFGIVLTLANAVGVTLIGLGLDIETPIGIAIVLAVQMATYFLLLWLLVVRTGALAVSDFDLGRPRHLARLVGDFLFGVGVMVPTTVVILIVTAIVFGLLGVQPPEVVPTPRLPAELALIALLAVVVVPVGEEIFFRGFALTAWLRDLGERAALSRSAIFFAVVHIVGVRVATFDEGLRQSLGVVLIILPVAVVLGLLFTRRGLMAAIGAHVVYNGIGYFGRLLAENVPPPAS